MFELEKSLPSGVRVGQLTTAHGKIDTPFFMPVGTQGSVKGISPSELDGMGVQIMLANTYHLFLRPGEKLIKKLGGLHEFINWQKPILTDSGGYQVFSLSEKKPIKNSKFKNQNSSSHSAMPIGRQVVGLSDSLIKIKNDGVEFKSYLDGTKHLFTPEKVIQIQLDLGVDILMPLDYCPSGKATKAEVERACKLTIDWAKRSKEYFDSQISNLSFESEQRGSSLRVEDKSQNHNAKLTNSYEAIKPYNNLAIKSPPVAGSRQNAGQFNNSKNRPLLFGIVQGGLDLELRRKCAKEIIKLNFDGYAVGGLAVDHETRDMWKTVKLMGKVLPVDNPRYLMGVGTPDDIIKATKLGMDMFDCVLPTRLGRHGSVYRRTINKSGEHSMLGLYKLESLLNSKFKGDRGVIDKNCGCYACRGGFALAYISHLIRAKEMLGVRLATIHNLWQYLELMKNLRGVDLKDIHAS